VKKQLLQQQHSFAMSHSQVLTYFFLSFLSLLLLCPRGFVRLKCSFLRSSNILDKETLDL
jgi:hypothetical protein